MQTHLLEILQSNKNIWPLFQKIATHKEFPSRYTLLESGEVSQELYLIEKGCLRLCFNHNGREITFQFFFENQGVSSIESFLNCSASIFSIETIEPSSVLVIRKNDLMRVIETDPEFKDILNRFVVERLINYTHLFLSRIKDTPQERYEELITTAPEILRRIPQHYIASYLGITPVSLSRIRGRR